MTNPTADRIKQPARTLAIRHANWLAASVISAALLWSYWPTISELAQVWQRNQDYSIGLLVPFVALYFVWRDRKALAQRSTNPCWWGLGVIGLVEVGRLFGVYYGFGSIERYALLGVIPSIVLLIFGFGVCWRLKWIWLFLLLMLPLPGRVHEAVAVPLQSLATTSAVVGVETLGIFVIREGNVLRLGTDQSVAVAEACSGLRMLTAFVFVAAVLAFVIERPRWQRAVLLAFSVPIAVLTNSLRVIATTLFIYNTDSKVLGDSFHDLAGLAMMPLAVVFSVGLLKLLAFFDESAEQPKATGSSSKHDRKRAPSAGRSRLQTRSARAKRPACTQGSRS